jgi:uncharacterized protein involved in exopolysaccharide biosynthesis
VTQLRSSLDANRDSLNRLQDAKIALENNLSIAEIDCHSLERSLEPKTAPPPASPRKQLQSEILQERYAGVLKRYSPSHPDARALRRAIAAALEEERSTALQDIPVSVTTGAAAPENALQLEQARERIRMLKAQIALTEKEFVTHTAEQDSICKEIADYQEHLGRLPLREQEMARLLRDYENSKSNYRMLLDKKLAAEMATDMEHRQKSERFSIVDPARPPIKPVGPNRPLLGAAGCLLALASGFGLSLLLESRTAVLLGEWELPDGVTVLGRLPVLEMPAEPARSPQVAFDGPVLRTLERYDPAHDSRSRWVRWSKRPMVDVATTENL